MSFIPTDPKLVSCSISLGKYHGSTYTSPERTIDQGKCLIESKWMRVMQHRVRMYSSKETEIIDDWLWVDYHDRVNVLVEAEGYRNSTQEKRFYIFRQTKYALEGRMSLAVVGGIMEPGEDAESTAKREVQEELHVQCQSFHFLGRFRTDVNRGMGWVNSFLAKDCFRDSHTLTQLGYNLDTRGQVGTSDTEKQEVLTLTISELRDHVRDGEFVEVQWSNTVALALLDLMK